MTHEFSITEMFTGMGTLAHAFAKGLARFGKVRFAGACELEPRYLGVFSRQHEECSTAGGNVTSYAPEELSFPSNGTRVFIAGIPCTGASVAGRSKNGLDAAEDHSAVGHLFLAVLHHIRLHRPDLCVFENVPPYANSFSATVIRQTLKAAGYHLFEKVVNPFAEFETPTERKRWIMVASRHGAFSWLYEAKPFTGTLDRFLDKPDDVRYAEDEATPAQVAADSKYIARKQSEGCGFAMRKIDGQSRKCPTIAKSYGKRQPSATFVTTRNSYRMIRPTEAARLHRYDEEIVGLIAELPATTAYEVIGQGVVAPPFEALGAAIGEWVANGCSAAGRIAAREQLELFAV